MPQQQQSNMVKPQKVGKMKKGMKGMAGKGGQQGFLNASKSRGGATDKPGIPKHPNFRSKMKASNAPKKSKGKRGAGNTPSYGKIASSVKKTMGY